MEKATRTKRIKNAINERIEKEKLELKQLILNTAAELFLEKGYEKFSLRQVAERIGYSATTIYLYFADKDDLLFSIVLEGFEIFYKKLSDAANSKDNTGDKLFEIGKAYILFGVENPVYYQMMFMQRTDLIMKVKPGDDKPMISSFAVLKDLVIKAIEEGIFIKKEGIENTYTNILWAYVHGVVSLHIVMPNVYTKDNLNDVLDNGLDLMIASFKTEK